MPVVVASLRAIGVSRTTIVMVVVKVGLLEVLVLPMPRPVVQIIHLVARPVVPLVLPVVPLVLPVVQIILLVSCCYGRMTELLRSLNRSVIVFEP